MIEVFLMQLTAASLLTGLVTEAVKAVCDELEQTYCSNVLAGCVSVIVSLLISLARVACGGMAILTPAGIVNIVALVLMSWLSAMVGYDKVAQTLKQIETYGKG